MEIIKVANIIEDGRMAGPQVRISEVAKLLNQLTAAHSRRDGAPAENKERKKSNNIKIETIVVFPFENGEEFKKKLQNNGIKYVQFPINRLARSKRFLLKYIFFFGYEIWLLFKFFRKLRFDIVHVSGGSWQYKGLIAGRLAGCKVLWHLNDTKISRLFFIIFKCVAGFFVDGFIVSGKRVREYYLGGFNLFNSKPVFDIQSPVDCSFYSMKKSKFDRSINSHFGLNIVSIGNINPYKGFEFFLQTANELEKKYSSLNYWIVGPCFESQKKYFRKIKKNQKALGLNSFNFYGNCKKIRNVLFSTDIYLCCSIAEASPLSVWEAMAMEKAIVATDVGDISSYIRDGYNGFVVQPGNVKEMSEKIAVLIEDEELRRSFGKKARKTALKYLDVERAGQEHYNAYKKILFL